VGARPPSEIRLSIPRRIRIGPPPAVTLQVGRDLLLSSPGRLFHRGKIFPYTLHRPRPASLFVRWEKIGDYLIERRGRKITACPVPDALFGEFRDLLLTTIASFALLERGVEPMHASCIGRGGRAVAFAGRAGSGKSTLAAFFARRGCEFLTDDLLPLGVRGRKVLAYPSVPEVKLHPRAAHALELNPVRLPPVWRGAQKRIWQVRHARRPLPLAAIYFPQVSPTARRPRLTRLSRSQLFQTLLRFNFNPQLQTRKRLRRQFALFSRLADSVPARRLIVPRGFHRLERVAERIEQDLAHTEV
jgi:hypothetical protein